MKLVILRFPVDILPGLSRHFTPILQLLFIELPDTEVWVLVLFLPLDWIEVGAELWESIELYCRHLLFAIQDIVNHLINIHGLLLVIS